MASPALQSHSTQPLTVHRTIESFSVDGPPHGLDGASPWIVVQPDADSGSAAGYRVLAHRVARRAGIQVIAVTSPARTDGKTTCAANLALALSEDRGRRVLLVEANRDTPRLTELFGLQVPSCFEAQLKERAAASSPQWSVVAVGSAQLHLLAVDPFRATGDWVSPRAYRRLVQQARAQYDYVLFDCSSVANPGDLPVIVDAADAVVFIARGGRSRARDLRRAIQQLAPTRILGVVLVGSEV